MTPPDRILLSCHTGATNPFNVVQLFVTTHIGEYGGPEPGSIHSSLILLPGDGSAPRGLQAVPLRLGRYTPDLGSPHVRLYDTGLSSEQVAVVWTWAESQIGDWYDFVGLLTIARFEIEHRLGRRPDVTRAFLDSPRATFFCSAYVAAALRYGGLDLAPGLPVTDAAPASIEHEAVRRGLRRV